MSQMENDEIERRQHGSPAQRCRSRSPKPRGIAMQAILKRWKN